MSQTDESFAFTPFTSTSFLQTFQRLVDAGKLTQLGAPSSTSTPAAPTSTTTGALAPWLKALGYVSDGEIIHAAMWNNLVTSIIQLATAMNIAPPQRDVTVSAWPILLHVGDLKQLADGETEVSFDQRLDGAVGGASPEGAKTPVLCGWMPLHLPDGFSVVALKLSGSMPDALKSWDMYLRRQKLGRSAVETMMTTDTASVPHASDKDGGAFATDQIPVPQVGHTPTQFAELTRIDNATYRYFFSTQARTPKSPELVVLRLVQVLCSRS